MADTTLRAFRWAHLTLERFEVWLGTLTAWVDEPGPSADENEMQP